MGILQHMEPECPQNGGARCSPGVQIPGRAFVCRGRSTRGESTARVPGPPSPRSPRLGFARGRGYGAIIHSIPRRARAARGTDSEPRSEVWRGAERPRREREKRARGFRF
eukprot:scaffold121445_cov63-Phaeocystis_antarctica.AAC.2